MSLSFPQLLVLLGLPLLLGAGILRAIGIFARHDRLAYLGWCWLTGGLGTGIAVFLWMWCAPNFEHSGRFQLLLCGIAVALWGRGSRRKCETATIPERNRAPRLERLLFALVVAFALFLVFERLTAQSAIPVMADDEAQFWALKAKALFLEGGFNEEFRGLITKPIHSSNVDYPPLNPLLQTLVFAQAEEVTCIENRMPILLFAPTLVLICAAALREVVRPAVAAGFLLLLVSCAPMHNLVLHAESDLMAAVGVVATFDAWRRWRRDGSIVWLRLLAIALAFLLWTKHEGLMLFCAMAGAAFLASPRRALLGIFRLRPRLDALWIFLPVALVASTWLVNGWLDAENNFLRNEARNEPLAELILTQFGERYATVLAYFRDRIALAPRHSNLIFPLFFLFLVAFPRRIWRSDLRWPAVAIVLGILGFLIIFTGLPHDIHWHLRTAAPRVAFHLIPVTLLWVAWAAGSFLPGLAPPTLRAALPSRDA